MCMIKKLFTLFTFIFLANCLCFASTPLDDDSSHYTQVKAAHILVSSESKAKALKNRIGNGETFAEVARKYSLCPSGEFGGNLGYFERGKMVKEFEDAAFSLPVGVVSDPVHTDFGWHLIKVYDKR